MAKPRPSVGVHMRLPREVVVRLDALATATNTTRGEVVQELVRRASVQTVAVTAPRLALDGEPPSEASEVVHE